MEIIIAIAVLGFALWWFFLRTPADTTPAAVYKVETPPTPEPVIEETKSAVEIVEGTITPIAAVTTVVVEESVAPAKKPRKPRAPKVVATPAKATVKKAAPKKAAAIKAAPKAKSKKV